MTKKTLTPKEKETIKNTRKKIRETMTKLKSYDVVIADLENMLKNKDELAANALLPPFVFEIAHNAIKGIKISIESAINDLCKLPFYADLKKTKKQKRC